MISRQELLELATQFSLRPDVVEKDYVLGWLLAGIGRHPALGDSWVFKGGTCLKKCYFETYRFSEDLDFTLVQPEQLDSTFLQKAFNEIADWIYEQTGLELPAENRTFEVYETHGKPAGQGRIGYRGPIAPRGDLPRVKLDLTNDECVVLSPVIRTVHRPYSDCVDTADITSYGYDEIFAEKLRALSERLRPRDLYDVIHMYRHIDLRPKPETVRRVLDEKCRYKNIPFPTLVDLNREPRRTELEAEWENMLAHQLPILPPFGQFWDEIPEVFSWISGESIPAVLPAIGEGEIEAVLTPLQAPKPATVGPIGRMPVKWTPPSVPPFGRPMGRLEVIRFSGANRLCVLLGYNGKKRLVEPYSLRGTKDRNLILHTVRTDNREHRAYRVDKIESAELTQQPFVPRYAIELTATGPLYAPPQGKLLISNAVKRSSRSPGTARYGNQTQKYIFRCSVCGKKFSRKSYDATLNEHKDKSGNNCFGRYGVYEGTK